MAKSKKNPAAREAAAAVVGKVLDAGAYTNIAVNSFLKNHELSDLERRFFTELVYGTVKASGVIDVYLGRCASRPLEKINREILNLLRVSLYQLLYLPRIPHAAVCNEAVNIARSLSHEGSAKFVNGVLRGFLRKFDKNGRSSICQDGGIEDRLAWRYYHPTWMVKRWLDLWGEDATEKLLVFNNSPAPVCLRVNTLKTTREKLLAKLAAAGAEAHVSKWAQDGILCARLPALATLFAEGSCDFYVQDENSMLVGMVADVAPGMAVLDLCSAPGGKSTHLAQLMGNKGTITACDIYPHKLALIKDNAKRLGIEIIDAVLNDATVLEKRWQGAFDRVLVDAPCSGLGVLRRRAEARWRKKESDLAYFPEVQLKALENAAKYVKATGRIIYSTCTIEQAENSFLIDTFLAKEAGWQRRTFKHPVTGSLVDELVILPQNDGIDGFYICVLEKGS